MEIIDKHFIALPKEKQSFVMLIIATYLAVGVIAYAYELATLVECSLLFVVGLLFSEMIKLQYRVEALEKKKK